MLKNKSIYQEKGVDVKIALDVFERCTNKRI